LEPFTNFVKWLVEVNLQLKQKFAIAITIILALTILNNIFFFTYNVRTNNKIEQLKELSKIYNDTSIDHEGRYYAKTLRTEIINRGTFVQSMSTYLSLLEFRETSTSTSVFGTNLWFHVSCAGVWYILGFIVTPILMLFKRQGNWIQSIAASILGMVVVAFIGFFIYFMGSLISYLFNLNFVVSIITNCVLQLVSLYFIFKLVNKFSGIKISY